MERTLKNQMVFTKGLEFKHFKNHYVILEETIEDSIEDLYVLNNENKSMSEIKLHLESNGKDDGDCYILLVPQSITYKILDINDKGEYIVLLKEWNLKVTMLGSFLWDIITFRIYQ